MRSPLSIAVAQPACVPGDVVANVAAHAAAVRLAGSRVVLFPELSLTGYRLGAPPIDPASDELARLVSTCASTGSVAFVGAPVASGAARYIATLAVTSAGPSVVYRKMNLGGAEASTFSAGAEPVAVDVDGWRLGLSICKDTGVPEHVAATAALGIDAYLAGVVHTSDELAEQDRRGATIAARLCVPVAFASAAGPVGATYPRTAGHSTIWAADATILARGDGSPGEIVATILD